MFKNKEKGFTLMEILVVVTILGLLVVIAIPSIKKLSQNINHKIYISSSLKNIYKELNIHC